VIVRAAVSIQFPSKRSRSPISLAEKNAKRMIAPKHRSFRLKIHRSQFVVGKEPGSRLDARAGSCRRAMGLVWI